MTLASSCGAALLWALCATAGPPHPGAAGPGQGTAAQADSAFTPPPGSAERRAIMDALRAEMRRFDSRPVVFVVRYLRVQRGWAWVEVDPRSPDGRSRYEGEAALLRRTSGRWRVVERMPVFAEREASGTEEDCAYFAELRRRFPSLPPRVLPPAGRTGCPARPRARDGAPTATDRHAPDSVAAADPPHVPGDEP